MHKSKFRKCVDFLGACVGLGVLSGMLFGSLSKSFGTPWGPLGCSLGHLGVTWDPKSPFSFLWGAKLDNFWVTWSLKFSFLALPRWSLSFSVLCLRSLGDLLGKYRKSFQNAYGIWGGSLRTFGESLGKVWEILWGISGESLGNPFRMLMESWGNL